jgi:beta-lactamase regulating signal transducer with metallopeptidase domain
MIATALLEAALRSLVMGAAVLAGLQMLRVRHVLARKMAWMLVLFASLAMPFLSRWQGVGVKPAVVVPEHLLITAAEIAVPVASTPVTNLAKSEVPASETTVGVPTVSLPAVSLPTVSLDAPMMAQASGQPGISEWSFPEMAREIRRWVVPVYLAVAAVLLLRLLIGLGLALRIWYRAERASPILEPRAWVRISSAVNAPVTIGSGIVLPENYEDWDRAKLRVVLAHERSHVRQGDFYLQLLAGLYTAIFWFTPLGWWMQRELSEAAEAISDRAALDEAANRSSYAEVLLEFAAMPRRSVAGVAMARSSNIQKRIDRLLTDRLFKGAFLGFRRHALLAALLVPIALLAAASLVRVEAAATVVLPNDTREPGANDTGGREQQTPAPMPQTVKPVPGTATSSKVAAPAQAAPVSQSAAPASATATAPAPVSAKAAEDETDPEVCEPEIATVTPEVAATVKVAMQKLQAVVPMMAEVRLAKPITMQVAVAPNVYVTTDHGADGSYAVLSDEDPTVYGSIGDWKTFSKERTRLRGDSIWFERDGKQYVINDPALAAQAREFFKPMGEMGRQQGELGKQQAELGREQGKLGMMQAEASVPMPDMSAEIKALEAELKAIQEQTGKEFSQEDMARLQAKIGEMQGKFSSVQANIAVKQSGFGEKQAALGAQQAELGKKQAELGKQQEKLSKEAQSKMKALIDEAVKNGKAKPVD